LTPNERFNQELKRDVEVRVRGGVKAEQEEVLQEEILQEEMTEHTWKPATGSSPRPGEASVTDTTPATW